MAVNTQSASAINGPAVGGSAKSILAVHRNSPTAALYRPSSRYQSARSRCNIERRNTDWRNWSAARINSTSLGSTVNANSTSRNDSVRWRASCQRPAPASESLSSRVRQGPTTAFDSGGNRNRRDTRSRYD